MSIKYLNIQIQMFLKKCKFTCLFVKLFTKSYELLKDEKCMVIIKIEHKFIAI